MSKRTLYKDPTLQRKTQYRALETSGEAQAALWEALSTMAENGFVFGPKATAILAKRAAIKQGCPK